MNVTFCCQRCDQTSRVDVDPADDLLTCPGCELALERPSEAFQDGRLTRCLVCPSRELFVRKDFPQRLGVAIVVLGFAISCVTWYFYWVNLTFAVLFATALIDVLLYVLVGDNLTCYRCGAEYRAVPNMAEHGGFDLATHERYRQQAARLAQHRPAGERVAGP